MPEYLMPDAGEGLTEADIVEWHVAEGDHVEINDDLVDIETAKSVVELPSPFAGTVAKILAQVGETVEVGKPIVFIDDGTGAPPETSPEADADEAPAPEEIRATTIEGQVSSAVAQQESSEPASVEAPQDSDAPQAEPAPAPAASAEPVAQPTQDQEHPLLVGYGPADEKTTVGAARRRRQHVVSKRDGISHSGAVVYTGDQEIPVDMVRRITAQNVSASKNNKVHTTTFVRADVTATKELVDKLRARKEFQGLHVTPLLIWCKAVVLALRHNPMLNAEWAPGDDKIILHHDVNIGIAADTPRGLLVPVIKQAQTMDLVEMATELTRLVSLAKQGKLQPMDYTGGTFTISNIGGLGLDAGTPIINGSESAILGLGTIKRQPWVVGTGDDERIEPRWVSTLSMAFDHRVIDGAGASNFLTDVATLVSDPGIGFLY